MTFAVSSPPGPHPAITPRDNACGFQGNPDLYGLGIRLGIYMQWISVFVVYMWYPEGHQGLAESYLIFIFALFIAIIVATTRAGLTYIAEILILMYIIFGGTFIILNIGIRKRHSLRVKVLGDLELTLVGLVTGGAAIYCSWFWFRIGSMDTPFLDTPCGSFGFLFAKVSLRNESVTKFFAALSVLYTIFGLLPVLIFLPWAVFTTEAITDNVSERPEPRARRQFAALPRIGESLELYKRRWIENLSWLMTWLFDKSDLLRSLLSACSLVYSILGIELSLHWNSVTGVYTIDTVGQLIPFVIGLVGLVKIAYMPIRTRYQEDRPISNNSRAIRESNTEDETHSMEDRDISSSA